MARKRLNRRLVIALSLVAFASMIALSALMLVQLQKGDPDKLAEIGRGYFEAGEWRRAASFYHRAYQKGGGVGYLVSAGEALLEDGEVGQALQVWRDALVQQPDFLPAHTHLLNMFLELARLQDGVADWRRVRDAAEAMLAVQPPDEQKAFANHAKGMALVRLGSESPDSIDRGLEALEAAVALAPQEVTYAIDLAKEHISRGQPEKGVSSLEALLATHVEPSAGAARARTAYAQYLASREQLAEAQSYFEEAVEKASGHPAARLEAKLAYADFLMRKWARARLEKRDDGQADRLFAEAESQMRACTAMDDISFDGYLELAVLYKAAGQYERIIDVCDERLRKPSPRKGLKATENKLNSFRLLVLASEACVAQALSTAPEDDPAARSNWLARARRYLDDANAEYVDHPKVLSMRGRIKLAEGRDREALEDFRKADEAYRSIGAVEWENKLYLARLHMNLNEPGAGLAVLEAVADRATGRRLVPFWDLYARILLRNTNADGTLEEATVRKIEEALARIETYDPDNPAVSSLRAALYERTGKAKQAVAFVDSPADRALLEARSLAEDGETERGLEVVMQALTQMPGNSRLVTTAVNELVRTDRTAEAREVVSKARQAAPDNVIFRKLEVMTGRELSAEERDRALLDIIESYDDAYQRSWDLIDYYWRRGDLAKALPYFDEAERCLVEKSTPMARNASMAQLRALLKAKLFLAAQLGDEPAMAAARDSAVAHSVDGAGGKSLVGLYHMYRKELEPALSAFREAVEAQPTDARLLTYLGHCYRDSGRLDDAEAAYHRAIRMNPQEGGAHKGLAAIAKQRGDTAAYEQHLDLCAKLTPADPWVRQELLTRQEEREPQRAIEDRERYLADHPDDLNNILRLAQLAEEVGDVARGDDYYERLRAARPYDKDTISLLAKYYRRTKRPDRALEVVSQFADSRTEPDERAEALIIVAAHYLNQNQMDKVEQTLLSAADVSPTLTVCRSLAEFYLRRIDEPKKALVWIDRAVTAARESRSPQLPAVLGTRIVCVLHRAISDIDAARGYVDEFLREFPDNPNGHLWDAEVYARRGRIADAIQSLTRYLAVRPHDAYALFQRAQHYAAMGRTAAAIEDLEAIKRADPTALGLEPRVLLARLHFQADRPAEWIAELESIVDAAPDSQAAVKELIGAYIRVGRLSDADRLVASYLSRAGADAAPEWYFLRGRVSVEMENVEEAIEDYKKGAERSGYSGPAVAETLALFARLKRYDEGVTFFEAHRTDANRSPVTLARYAHLLARSGRQANAVAVFRDAMAMSLSGDIGLAGFVVREIVSAFSPDIDLSKVPALFEETEAAGPAARANDRILARLYAQTKRFDDAGAILTRLLETVADDRERAVLLQEQGDLYQVSGRAQEAVASYEQAIEYDEDNWVVLNNAAYVLSDQLGEYERAKSYATRAVAASDNAATLDTLGWIYVGLTQYQRAIAELSRSVRLDPTDPMAFYHLGEAYRRNGQFVEAADVLSRGRNVASSGEQEEAVTLIDAAREKARNKDATFRQTRSSESSSKTP